MNYVIMSDKIVMPDGVVGGRVPVANGKISVCGDREATVLDLSGYTVMPGLVDIHSHGGKGYDATDSPAEDLIKLARYKLSEGVTSFCPATVTTSLEKIRSALANIREAMKRGTGGARIIGAFLEGPYLGEKYRGAHAAEFLRQVSTEELGALIDEFPDVIKSVAIAPELPGAPEAIRYMTERGVNVRIGHSAATYEQARHAVECGANISIHTFNAMSPLGHREPGMVGAALSDPGIFAELICDFIHVSEPAVDIAIRCKGADKLVLVTDCVSAGGLPDGEYRLGELKTFVRDSVPRTETGALAGSSLRLTQAVKNIHKVLGTSLADAVKMASRTPARALGLDNEIGGIRPGMNADIIAVDNDFNVKLVMVSGEIVLNEL